MSARASPDERQAGPERSHWRKPKLSQQAGALKGLAEVRAARRPPGGNRVHHAMPRSAGCAAREPMHQRKGEGLWLKPGSSCLLS
jgi:hypothetical protein